MELLDQLLSTLPDGLVETVCIGIHWTTVVVEVAGERRCGLATTLRGQYEHGETDVPRAGHLGIASGRELAALSQSQQPIMRSVGMAAVNALLRPMPNEWVDLNADNALAIYGAGKRVVLVGHFPFVHRLRRQVGELTILEKHPHNGDLGEEAAPRVIPKADLVAITSMTLINQSFEELLTYCSPGAFVVLLGPSTPLSPILFDYGIDLLCGSEVTDIDAVLRAVEEGANFRQVHQAGVRLVTMGHPGLLNTNLQSTKQLVKEI
jgi:uncharacterized protein (DUF4213/DUF364 family)